jgi:hypothetical protein
MRTVKPRCRSKLGLARIEAQELPGFIKCERTGSHGGVFGTDAQKAAAGSDHDLDHPPVFQVNRDILDLAELFILQVPDFGTGEFRKLFRMPVFQGSWRTRPLCCQAEA